MERPVFMGVILCLLLLGCSNDDDSPTCISWPGTSASKGSSDLNISGKAFYEDKPYTASGFTGAKINTPIRHAIINVIANDCLVKLSSSQTGEDGSFTFNKINNSSRLGGVHLQIEAKNADDSASPAEVRNSQSANPPALLTINGPTLNDSVSNNFTSEQIIVPTDTIGGAFNILDNFLKGGAFIQKPGFCPTMINPNAECKAPFVTAYWQPGSNQGSFFESQPPAISLCGGGCGGGDTDEYDDAVILHEYGHFIATIFSQDTSPGGNHSIGDNTQDIRLSWSEGWATFFASAVLGSPLVVDTSAGGGFNFEIESAPGHIYTTNELSISAVLWDIFDAPSPDDDPITTIAFPPVWKSFMNIPTATSTIEEFARLFIADNPASVNNFKTILTTRSIEFSPDAGESGEATLIVGGALQHHTLYKTDLDPFGDEDVIPFNVNSGQTVIVKTFNLTNGADTFLTLDGGGGIVTNDNADGKTYILDCSPCPKNDSTTLSSSIQFTPTIGGTFSVRVKRSPGAPLSTGQSGSYDIKLTSP
jgi:hypothetical protein